MNEKTVLILERSSQNLKKISKDGKTVLEGVFAEFGVENRNGRVYEEKEYLPHLEYLKKDITNGNLLGELDHPEKFEVALGNVSHRITELWYDQSKRQILGRIEILEGTPKGQIAKTLLEAGVPLSISSRAAGSVNEDKTVQIQQIYTYDLVAKPGFEAAQLRMVTEAAGSKGALINKLLENMNNSLHKNDDRNINEKLGIINENISIIDVTDKFPALKLREEAQSLIKNNPKSENMKNDVKLDETAIQNWTVQFNAALMKLDERVAGMESRLLEAGAGSPGEMKAVKAYIEKLRKIQESAINWQSDIAKAVNKLGTYADKLADKSNSHYRLTKKLVETVDYNAEALNHTQDWVGNNAKVTNAIAETVDHNAQMTNKLNEWNEEIASAVNKLNEWGEEKARAINGMHEWTSDIAKNVNHTANYAEQMFGRAMSKADAKKLIEYIELVAESKQNDQLKKKINEMLTINSINKTRLNETTLKPLEVLDADTHKARANVKVDTKTSKSTDVEIDSKSQAIVSKFKNIKFKASSKPKEVETKLVSKDGAKITVGKNGVKGVMVLDTTKTTGKGKEGVGGDGPKNKDQHLKLDQKPITKLKEQIGVNYAIKQRSSKLDEKLAKIVKNLEKEKAIDENVKTLFPFTTLLSESDRKRFAALSATDKQKVAVTMSKNPTVESGAILKLWENALAGKNANEPKWLAFAPKDTRALYEAASPQVKESLNARAEFYELETQYQINNFWETSGLIVKPTVTLNESVTIKSNKDGSEALDPFMKAVAEKLASYNS